MIAVVGASGTIGRRVAGFLEEWGAPFVRRDARLEGEEALDASDSEAVARGARRLLAWSSTAPTTASISR